MFKKFFSVSLVSKNAWCVPWVLANDLERCVAYTAEPVPFLLPSRRVAVRRLERYSLQESCSYMRHQRHLSSSVIEWMKHDPDALQCRNSPKLRSICTHLLAGSVHRDRTDDFIKSGAVPAVPSGQSGLRRQRLRGAGPVIPIELRQERVAWIGRLWFFAW